MTGFREVTRLAARLGGLGEWALVSLILGIAVNLLSFVSPLFMMQIMDTVVPAQDQNTLLILLGFGGVAFMFLSVLDGARKVLSVKVAVWTETRLTDGVLSAGVGEGNDNVKALGGVRQIVSFLRGGASTLIDAPISLLAFFILWLILPSLAIVAAVTACLLLGASILRSSVTRRRFEDAAGQRKHAMALADALVDSGVTAASMGIGKNVEQKFLKDFSVSLVSEAKASSRGEWLTGASRFARQFAQITALTIGALHVMEGTLSGGAMIAGSIIMGKALAPFDQLSSAWDAFTSAIRAAKNVNTALGPSQPNTSTAPEKITPDRIKPVLRIENVTIPRGAGAAPILDRINFVLHPGECLAIVGPTGAGKTMLGDVVAGLTKAPIGEISLDGIPYEQIPQSQLASLIGYAPQTTAFFPGTVAENIARFKPDADKSEILDAVQRARVEEFVRKLPNGFDAEISAKGHPLSSGQARRVALARAVFGHPKLVILDEPASGLDEAGEKALMSLVSRLKADGVAIVLIAQRAGLLAAADKLVQLEDGRLRDFGEKNEVLMRLSMQRSQIDLSPTLDEAPRLFHWLGVHLARAEDGPVRARAELALMEVFHILRQRKEITGHEKISVNINYTEKGIQFAVHSGVSEPVFGLEVCHASGQNQLPRDLNDLDQEELGHMVVLSSVHQLKEEIIDNRLHISFYIEDVETPSAFEPRKISA